VLFALHQLLLEHGNAIPPERDFNATAATAATATADLSKRGRLVDGHLGDQTTEVQNEELQTDELQARCEPKIMSPS
jgi:hypothetical protein